MLTSKLHSSVTDFAAEPIFTLKCNGAAGAVGEESVRTTIIAVRLSRLGTILSVNSGLAIAVRYTVGDSARCKVEQPAAVVTLRGVDSDWCAIVITTGDMASVCEIDSEPNEMIKLLQGNTDWRHLSMCRAFGLR